MATIKTRYTIGSSIQFVDDDGNKRTETVQMIECQVVKGCSVWIIYGYGHLYKPNELFRANQNQQIRIDNDKIRRMGRVGMEICS